MTPWAFFPVFAENGRERTRLRVIIALYGIACGSPVSVSRFPFGKREDFAGQGPERSALRRGPAFMPSPAFMPEKPPVPGRSEARGNARASQSGQGKGDRPAARRKTCRKRRAEKKKQS